MRLSIYSSLKIPEVWRCDGERLTFLSLGHDGVWADRSEPMFSEAFTLRSRTYLAKYDTMGENRLVREFRQWVRETQLPHG